LSGILQPGTGILQPGKMIDFDGTISEIVKKDPRTAEVFKKYKLSYCCSGNIPLKSACTANGIDYLVLTEELRISTRNLILSENLPFGEWKIDFLIDLISNIHHTYIYQYIPPLSQRLESFTVGHRDKYPELITVVEIFTKITDLLIVHNRHEDEIIFPYIKQIYYAFKRKEPYGNLFVRTLRKPLHMIEQEHLQIKKLLDSLKLATKGFTPPDNACVNYLVLYKEMEEVYDNLAQHMFLEDDFLFPKAIDIERKLLQF